jgi:hypothetical protein
MFSVIYFLRSPFSNAHRYVPEKSVVLLCRAKERTGAEKRKW